MCALVLCFSKHFSREGPQLNFFIYHPAYCWIGAAQKRYRFKPLGPAAGPVKNAIFAENTVSLYNFDKRAALAKPERFAEIKAGYVKRGPGRSNLHMVMSATRSDPGEVLRRVLIKAVLSGATFGLAIAPAAAQQKMSQSDAAYQDQPKDGLTCAACSLFRPPRSCAVVEGDISPNGWCKFFDLAD